MQEGLKTAINIPLTVMRLGDAAWDSLREVARYGNPASKSDLQVGARALQTGIWGAYQNVLINIKDVRDETYKEKILKEAECMQQRADEKSSEILSILKRV